MKKNKTILCCVALSLMMTGCASSAQPRLPDPKRNTESFYLQFTNMVPARYLRGVDAMQAIADKKCITLAAKSYSASGNQILGSTDILRNIANQLTGNLRNDGANSYRINAVNWSRYSRNGGQALGWMDKLDVNVTSMVCQ